MEGITLTNQLPTHFSVSPTAEKDDRIATIRDIFTRFGLREITHGESSDRQTVFLVETESGAAMTYPLVFRLVLHKKSSYTLERPEKEPIAFVHRQLFSTLGNIYCPKGTYETSDRKLARMMSFSGDHTEVLFRLTGSDPRSRGIVHSDQDSMPIAEFLKKNTYLGGFSIGYFVLYRNISGGILVRRRRSEEIIYGLPEFIDFPSMKKQLFALGARSIYFFNHVIYKLKAENRVEVILLYVADGTEPFPEFELPSEIDSPNCQYSWAADPFALPLNEVSVEALKLADIPSPS